MVLLYQNRLLSVLNLQAWIIVISLSRLDGMRYLNVGATTGEISNYEDLLEFSMLIALASYLRADSAMIKSVKFTGYVSLPLYCLLDCT
jgi:hypothetical protein